MPLAGRASVGPMGALAISIRLILNFKIFKP
jgi:hypothetical protein